MAVVKNKLKMDFSQIPNEVLVDNNLKDGAKILLLYLFSKPDDWQVMNNEIKKSLNIKQNSTIASYWKQLIENGWIKRYRRTDENGKFIGGLVYELNETPIFEESPNVQKPQIVGKPTFGETQKLNNMDSSTNTDLSTNKKTKEKKKFNFKDKLLELGADSDLIDDWLYVRKKKRAVNTERALSGFLKEVEKSGQSLNNIIEMCVVKSWRGFEADWLKEEQSLNNKFDKKCQAVRDGEIDSIKAFKNYKENKTVENAATMWNTFALNNGFIFKETLERWDATNFQNRLQESDFDLPNILIALKDMPSDQKKYYTFDSLIKNETQYKKLLA